MTITDGLIETHSPNEISKARIVAQWIKVRVHFKELKNVGVFFVALLERSHSPIVVSDSKIGIHKSRRWDVA